MKTFSGRRRSSPSVTPPNGEGQQLGDHLRLACKLTEQDIKDIVHLQRREKLLFGEAAVGLGLVSEQELQEALSRQYEYPFAALGSDLLDESLVAAHQAFGSQAEAFRTLRSQLMLRWYTDNKKSLAVTATRHGDGASSVAANLAIVFAQCGQRTLLIDANLREPAQARLFGLTSPIGLSTLLSGRCAANEAFTTASSFENLYVLPAGSIPPNPQELLNRISFSYLVETAPTDFDVVIIDTPPILECSDAQLIAALATACLLVTRRDVTMIEDIERAKALLEPTHAQLVGAVIRDS